MILTAASHVLDLLGDVAELDGDMLCVFDEERFRKETIVEISATAVSENRVLAEAASWLVWTASQSLGSGVGSLKGAYDSMGRSEVSRTTVACFEVPLATVPPVARAVFAAADALDSGTICFAPRVDWRAISTSQRRIFLTNILTAAIQKKWTMPVFLEAGPFFLPSAAQIDRRRTLAASMSDGFWGISLVPQTKCDASASTEHAASRWQTLVELGHFIRKNEPVSQPVSLTAAAQLSEDWSRESVSSCAAQLGAASVKIGLSKFQLPTLEEALSSPRASRAMDTISQLAGQLRTGNRIAGASIGGNAWLDDALTSELLDCKTVEARLGTWLDVNISAISSRNKGTTTFEASIKERVRKLLDRLEQRGTRDFVRKHAIPMPCPRPRPTSL